MKKFKIFFNQSFDPKKPEEGENWILSPGFEGQEDPKNTEDVLQRVDEAWDFIEDGTPSEKDIFEFLRWHVLRLRASEIGNLFLRVKEIYRDAGISEENPLLSPINAIRKDCVIQEPKDSSLGQFNSLDISQIEKMREGNPEKLRAYCKDIVDFWLIRDFPWMEKGEDGTWKVMYYRNPWKGYRCIPDKYLKSPGPYNEDLPILRY